MEESSVPNRPPEIPKPPNPTPQNLQTSQLPPATASASASRPPLLNKNKRKVDHVDTHQANLAKLCGIVKDLRPDFVEILQVPDFRNSKTADEIRKKMELVMEVYKQTMLEAPSMEPSKKPVEGQSLPGENMDGQGVADKQIEKKLGECRQSLPGVNISGQRVADKNIEEMKRESQHSLPVENKDGQRVADKRIEEKQGECQQSLPGENKDGQKVADKHIKERQGEHQHSLPGENKDGPKLVSNHIEERQDKHRHPVRVPVRPLEPPVRVPVRPLEPPVQAPVRPSESALGESSSTRLENDKIPGSYIVGGSNFGWNYVMYPGNKAVYYGVTKESHRLAKEQMGAPHMNST